jgi:hypothetical protein
VDQSEASRLNGSVLPVLSLTIATVDRQNDMAGLDITALGSDPNFTNILDGTVCIGEIEVDGVSDMVREVLAVLARNRGKRIRSLTIADRGAPGYQSVGASGWDETGDFSLQVAPGTKVLLGAARREIPKLAGKFTRDGVVNLCGCEVAKGPAGLELLKVVSHALGGTFVQAGPPVQCPLVPGWEGNVLRCTRDTCWIASYGYLCD